MFPRLRRPIPVLLGILALCVSLLPQHTEAQTAQRCFPETGFCIAGRIREFWEQNGGLPVFGYPITLQQEETIEGQPAQVQWFERNRLELHPENERPYDVLIGRLGVDRLEQQGRDWFAFPRSEPQEGCRFFAETGHNVCGDVLTAWRARGLEFDGTSGASEAENLALFGLPLGDAQVEMIDGQEYTVQWFERARFELHPENAPPYNVLLGLLGNEVHGPAAPPPPQPIPASTARIVTSVGTLVIDEVQMADRFPLGCDPNPFYCDLPQEGYQMLVIWLARQDGGDPGEIGGALFGASKEAYVVADDDARSDRRLGGLQQGRLVVVFITPASARTLTLFWPGNPPITLKP
ncbi:MAG: hypothetical protein MI924_28630 [Chloroflexales bacterium]|nr:hypothetical protein [Chloroflexales bacterium]